MPGSATGVCRLCHRKEGRPQQGLTLISTYLLAFHKRPKHPHRRHPCCNAPALRVIQTRAAPREHRKAWQQSDLSKRAFCCLHLVIVAVKEHRHPMYPNCAVGVTENTHPVREKISSCPMLEPFRRAPSLRNQPTGPHLFFRMW